MSPRISLEERCHKVLEEKGGQIADEARTILLEENSLRGLLPPLKYISGHWRDPLTPALVILSCEAVGGKPDDATHQAALAVTLMSLGFNLWDDIVDKTVHKGFTPTVFGKFGESVTLMIGGLASAKAFLILSGMRVDETRRQKVVKVVWDYWTSLAKAENRNLELRERSEVEPQEKLRVMIMKSVNLEASSKIGATLGSGSRTEIRHLGNCGKYLGAILELRKDFDVSINLTGELSEKIRGRSLPYTLSWAKSRSEKIQHCLPLLSDKVEPADIKRLVEAVLETGALENISFILSTLAKKSKEELRALEASTNSAFLTSLVEAQRQLFALRLSALLGYR